MLSVLQKSHICNIKVAIRLMELKQTQDLNVRFATSGNSGVIAPAYLRGVDYLRDPRFNKGLAFTLRERQVLGIQGLMAASYKTQEEQVKICSLSFDRYEDPLNKYLYLCHLHEANERLFFSLLNTDVKKYLPIVYTPTVGLACQKFGLAYNHGKGLFISIKDKGHIYNVLQNWPIDNVRAICVTDGERILGLGDLGAFGMGIPIGKLCLYTALGGVKPHQCLPITLDTGTNNENLLVDPLYIGTRIKRVRGPEYDAFLDEFMEACVTRFGIKTLIQFEDFSLINAPRLLQKYQNKYCVFNDDIQGTAAVAVAGVLAATRITKVKISDSKFLFFGAGSAAAGISKLLVDAMVDEGLSIEKARGNVFLYDINGLVSTQRPSGVPDHIKDFGKNMPPSKDFAALVKSLKPTCLIGVSAQAGVFTPAILQEMTKNTERPVIMALSNPTHLSECTAQVAYDNTKGRCVYTSGSPMPPVQYNNKTYHTGQGNNSYIFPGVALGVIAANIAHISDNMFLTAAKCLANMVKEEDLNIGRIFPPIRDLKKISLKMAEELVLKVYKDDKSGMWPKPASIPKFIESHTYNLTYPSYIPDEYEYTKKDEFTPKSIEEIAHLYTPIRKKIVK